MKLRRQKKLALALVTATFVACGTLAVFGRHEFEERWLLWRLGSSDFFARQEAARKLGELKSIRAVPILLHRLAGEAGAAPPFFGCIDADESFSTRPPGRDRGREHLARGQPYWDALLAYGKDGVSVLTHAIGTGPVPERIWAAALLGRLFEELTPAPEDRPLWDEAGQALVSLLGHDDEELRWQAADALLAESDFVEGPWIDVLESGNDKARLCATWALRSGAAETDPERTSLFLKMLRDPSLAVRNEASLALSEEANPELLPFLAEALASEQVSVRQGALNGLARLAPGHPEAVRLLLGALADSAENVRTFAALGLAALGPSAVPHFAAALKHENPTVRAAAARSLAWMDYKEAVEVSTARDDMARFACAAMEPLLQDPSAEVREQAAEALGRVVERTTDPDARLLRLLGSDDPRVQAGAARALLARGEPVDGAARRLLDLILISTHEVRIACLEALGMAKGDVQLTLPAILKALRSESDEMRSAALSALRSLRDQASGAYAGLAGMVVDRSLALELRRAALQGLAVTGIKPEVVVTALEAAVREQTPGSAAVFARDGEDAAPLAAALIDLVKTAAFDEQTLILLECLAVIPGQLAAALPAFLERPGMDGEHYFLGRVGGHARGDPVLVDALVAALGDERTRLPAVRALGYAGEAARSALPELKRLGRGASPELADALSWAVDEIQMRAEKEP